MAFKSQTNFSVFVVSQWFQMNAICYIILHNAGSIVQLQLFHDNIFIRKDTELGGETHGFFGDLDRVE